MSIKKPIRTKKFVLSIIDERSFVISRLKDEKQSEIYAGHGADISYECFEQAMEHEERAFDDLCTLEMK